LSDLLKKGDSTGFASFYCTDAKIMAPDGPAVVGRDAIKSTIGYFYNIGLTGMELKTLDVWGSEAIVAEEGTVVFTMKDGKEYDHGKYIVLWKMEDGKWKLFRDIFNTDIPKPAAK
jgi:ketosteroid isomerase-like protein